MQLLTVEAKPEPISIDPAGAALIVVDMQNDFGSEGGMFDRAGIDISGIREAVSTTARVLPAARGAGIPIVYLKMGYRPDLSDLGETDAPNRVRHLQIFRVGDTVDTPDGRPGRILIRDTWGTDIVAALAPQPGDTVLYKTRYSGFYQTELDDTLRAASIRQLIVTGCTTSVCVESTVRDAFFRDYQCLVLSDCTSEPLGKNKARSNHEASLAAIEVAFGWTSTSDEFLKALESQIDRAA